VETGIEMSTHITDDCVSCLASGKGSVEVPRKIRQAKVINDAVVRFVGDSGDGMQLTGTEMTRATALAGNDIATFPDYPAEIRAPAGTPAGVSGFQLRFASHDIFSPGDAPDTLVAMNPAALKVHLRDVHPDGIVIVNTATFTPENLKKAGYLTNPLEDGTLESHRMIAVDFDAVIGQSPGEVRVSRKDATRSRNFFALGLVFWLYSRDAAQEVESIRRKFASKPELAELNIRAFHAGFNFGETSEAFDAPYRVPQAALQPGKYRNITGNGATALGLLAGAERAGLRLFLGTYPITPASDILHELSKHLRFDVRTFQAEDEIAAVCAAIGASFAGALGATTTSGPGMALKTEAIGLAVMIELPLVIVNVQRGGPSTGLPTKTEQSDLFQAVYGRNGECPLPVLAARSPADCFDCAVEATRIAVEYRTPVILLTDGFLGNSSEPWRLPNLEEIPRIDPHFSTIAEGFAPYARDPETLARAWAVPGTAGLEHRVGGLEKDFLTGDISYDGPNHHKMVAIRAEKVARVARTYPPTEVFGDPSGEVLVIGWGGTYGSLRQGVIEAREGGRRVGFVHLRHIYPLPADLLAIAQRYRRVLVPELNLGQLGKHLRAQLGLESESLCKVEGKPLRVLEIVKAIEGSTQSLEGCL
jgi:2-oxoglutarate/2-oxoacid ferredoxin oxidoreductase subunit alpha